MRILSYNIFGVKNTKSPIPNWDIRQVNLNNNLRVILKDENLTILCFQEVNENNIDLLNKIVTDNGYYMVQKFPMKTETILQYNIIAVKNDEKLKVLDVFCLPHGKDEEYKDVSNQMIDYNMSDYRTTVFVKLKYKEKTYLVGCIHTDYISTEGKIKGTVKTLDYMDKIEADYKLVVGDMNMISHMSEVYNILKQNDNYITVSRNKNFIISDNSWHGYGTMEQVNVDFAFVEKTKEDFYNYEIIKQNDIMNEGSDHRPIIITISGD